MISASNCLQAFSYNPRLFNLLWSYYERKVALPAATATVTAGQP